MQEKILISDLNMERTKDKVVAVNPYVTNGHIVDKDNPSFNDPEADASLARAQELFFICHDLLDSRNLQKDPDKVEEIPKVLQKFQEDNQVPLGLAQAEALVYATEVDRSTFQRLNQAHKDASFTALQKAISKWSV